MGIRLSRLTVILFLAFGIFVSPCRSQTVSPEIFKVARDTIRVDIEGRLSRALLVHDKYYAFYEVRDPMSNRPIKKFYIIEKNGKIERQIKVPEGINREFYYRLYYWRGRIIVNTEFYKNTYYLDLDRNEFVTEPETTTIPLFEDENYQVTSRCNGEFGSTIYFKDKRARGTYAVSSGCPYIINKLADKYFVNTSDGGGILEIDDPRKAPSEIKHISFAATSEFTTQITTRTIFNYNYFDAPFYIPTSFVAQGVLYHIFNSCHFEFSLDNKGKLTITNDSVKIGTIKDGEFKPVYKLKDKFDIQLEQQLSPAYQICTFHTEEYTGVAFKKDIPPYKEAKYGLIEIMGNEIKIHYFISKKAG
jgi:hypothetical protein